MWSMEWCSTLGHGVTDQGATKAENFEKSSRQTSAMAAKQRSLHGAAQGRMSNGMKANEGAMSWEVVSDSIGAEP